MKKIILLLISFIFTYNSWSQQCIVQGLYGNASKVYNSDGTINPNYFIIGGDRGDNYGLSDVKGNLIVPQEYDPYFIISNGKTISKNFNKKTIDLWDLNTQKKVQLPGISGNETVGDNGLIAIEFSNEKWGYCDITGKIVLPAKYSFAEEFTNGRALVTMNYNEYGIIDDKGNWVVEPKKISYIRYAPNVILFQEETGENTKSGLMDINGKIVIPEGIYENFEFRSGIIEAIKGDKKGDLYNYSLKKLTNEDCWIPDGNEMTEATDGYIVAMDSKGYEFVIDTNGNKYLQNKYEFIQIQLNYFTGKATGLFTVETNPADGDKPETYAVVKLDGTVLIDGNINDVVNLDDKVIFTGEKIDGRILFSLRKINGDIIKKDVCDNILEFYKQYAFVTNGNKRGVLNVLTGEWVIPLEYAKLLDVSDCSIKFADFNGKEVDFDQDLNKISK
ncbi:MAG: WG repeat-containing protein [Chitinophagales bacterium]|nr:WG repeat-containing protein [Chitinophagales bacterium]